MCGWSLAKNYIEIKNVMAAFECDQKLLCVGNFTRKLSVTYKQYLDLVQKGSSSSVTALTDSLSEYGAVSDKCIKALLEYLSSGKEDPKVLSWGQFTVTAVDLLYNCEGVELLPVSSYISPKYHISNSKEKKGRGDTVFLGGSCNPTVWRKETSIPMLEAAGIKYYNPQVDEWYPELIDIEDQAKQDAAILLFVVDTQTRAISSMVEIGLLIGAGRRLVIVLKDIDVEESLVICGDKLCQREVADLNRGRHSLREILRLHSVIVEPSVAEGTRTVIDLLKHHLSSDDLVAKRSSWDDGVQGKDGDKIQALRICDHLALINGLIQLRRSNELPSKYQTQVLKLLTPSPPPSLPSSTNSDNPLLSSLASLLVPSTHDHTHDSHSTPDPLLHTTSVSNNSDADTPPSDTDTPPSDFDRFCVCYSELKYRSVQTKRCGFVESLSYLISSPTKWINEWVLADSATPLATMTTGCSSTKWDIFLGGSCGSSKWRDSTAIPLLRKNNVTYFNPYIPDWKCSTLKLESPIKDACSLLLFIITGETLSIESLIEAAYYIGLGRQVVLCIQDITVDGTGYAAINGLKLNAAHLKDYNRGRSYLRSLAKKAGVTVHDNVADTVMWCIRKLKGDEHHQGTNPQQRRGTKRSLSTSDND